MHHLRHQIANDYLGCLKHYHHMAELTQPGRIIWIGIRKTRYEPLTEQLQVDARAGVGLEGDHYHDPGGKRQITLIMAEDLQAAAAELGRTDIDPGLVRRNVVVAGIDLHQFKQGFLRLGACLIEVTGDCPPCKRMEENLGAGGLKSLTNRGGVTGRILEGGLLALQDEVRWA